MATLKKNSDMAKMEGQRKFGFDQAMTVLCFVLLVIIAAIPVVLIAWNAIYNETTKSIDFPMMKEVLLDPANVKAMWHSIEVCVLTTIIATVVGVFFAWLLARSDVPGKGVMKFMFKIPFMVPPFLGAMAWNMLLNSRMGYMNKWLIAIFELEKAPFNINSVGGIVFVEVIYFFSFVYNQVVAALERMDPTLEECARIAGAKQMYVIMKVTLPLVMPAISAGMLLVLITSIANYGIAATLGFSGNIYTLPTKITEIMQAAMGHPDGIRRASIVSLLLIAVVAIALIVQSKLLNSGRFDIIKGKAMRPALMKLRGARYPLMIVAIVALFIMVVMPFICIIVVSFLKTYGLDVFDPASYTLANYKHVLFQDTKVWRSVGNSLFLSVGAGVGALFLGVILSWVIYKVKPKGKGVLEFLGVLPYSIPGTVLAVCWHGPASWASTSTTPFGSC